MGRNLQFPTTEQTAITHRFAACDCYRGSAVGPGVDDLPSSRIEVASISSRLGQFGIAFVIGSQLVLAIEFIFVFQITLDRLADSSLQIVLRVFLALLQSRCPHARLWEADC